MSFRNPVKKILNGALFLILILASGSCASFIAKNIHWDGADSPVVRVLLLTTGNSFTVSSDRAIRISGEGSGTDKKSAVFLPEEIRTTVRVEPNGKPLMLNGMPYRGYFEIVPAQNAVHIINIVRVDEYLSSVVPCEIPSGWEPDALKAQAVAARTYTYYHIIHNRKRGSLYDLDATVNSQVYRGISDEKPSTTEAVLDTRGEILLYDGMPILSYFHSTCGGKTTDDALVWKSNQLPYLNSVKCGYCGESTKYSWETVLTIDEIARHVSVQNPGMGPIRTVTFRRKNDRVTDVEIKHTRGTITISGNNFRLMFPPEKILSLYFTSKKSGSSLVLLGHGWGHGVGLCQWGARGMARSGFNYREILNHYYTRVKIKHTRSGYLASKIHASYTVQ